MKRIFMLFICMCLALSNTVVLAENSDISSNIQNAVDVLIALDVLNADYSGEALTEYGNVTRADFADMIAKVFAQSLTSENLYFHDVPRTHWAFNPVSNLVELGIVRVGDSKMFNPGDNITVEDALRMLTRALGYKSTDDTTQTIHSISRSIGLLDNVTITGDMDIETACVLLYNALLAPVTEIISYNDGSVTYRTSGRAYIEEQFSTYLKQGVLEGYDEISITDDVVPEDMCVISGEKFYIGDTDMENMLGSTILYLYKQSRNGDKTIIWAKPVSTEDRVILYADKDLAYFDKDTYEFRYISEDTQNEKAYSLKRSASVIYNGEFVEDNIEELLSAGFYSVTLIRATGVGSFDTAVVWKNDNYIVSGIDKSNMIVYDMISKQGISLKTVERLDIYASNGKKIEFEELQNETVISVYLSASGKRAKILCSDTVVSGEIASVNTRYGKKVIEIDGVAYEDYNNVFGNVARIGKRITLYLDANNCVAYAKYAAGSKNVGYLVKTTELYGVFDLSFSVKIFDESGEMIVIESAEEMTVNGTEYQNVSEALDAIGGDTPQIIAYELNSDGKLSAVETAQSEPPSEPALHIRNPEGSYPYRKSGKLGASMYISSDTVIFGIPRNLEDEENFTIVSSLTSDTQYTNVSSYALDQNSGYEEYIIIKGWDWFSPSSSARGILVTGSGETLNDDEKPRECLFGYQGQTEVTLLCAESYSAKAAGVKNGDYISYKANGDGEITNIDILYSPSDNASRPKSVDVHLGQSFVTTGYVNAVNDGVARIGHNDGSVWESAYDFGTAVVLTYDKTENIARPGSIEDLIPYEAAGGACSFVLMHSNWGSPLVYIIYK